MLWSELWRSNMTPNEQKIVARAIRILDKEIKSREVVFTEPQLVKDYLRLQLQESKRELFLILYLDSQHRLIASDVPFMGTIDAAPVYPRIVVQSALAHNAAAVILSHNHPSGVAEPSRADRAITDRLQQALTLVDIRLLDHIVVGAGAMVSFAERGYL